MARSKDNNRIVKYNQPCPCGKSSDALQVYADGHSTCFSGKCGGTTFWPDKKPLEASHISIRGLSERTVKKLNIRTSLDSEGVPDITSFTFPNGNAKFRRNKVELNSGEKYYALKDQKPEGILFADVFPKGSAKYITVTEGEFDAASVYDILGYPAYPCLKKKLTDEEWELLNSFERIYVVGDNDSAGREYTAKFVEKFPHNKVYVVHLTEHGDVNDYLLAGDRKKFEKAWWAARPYCPDDVLATPDDFSKVLDDNTTSIIVPTFMDSFNNMAYGLVTGHIFLIKGLEGLGKTELLRKLAWHTFKTSEYNLATIFLEESAKRTVQGFVCYEIGEPVHFPDSETPKDTIAQVARGIASTGRMNIVKMVDIDTNEKILNKIRYLVTQRECKFIFLDPINQLGHNGDNTTKELDSLMAKLEKMVVELDFCLVITAHVNDEGQTRDSRMIQKAASIRIELYRDNLHPDPIIRNTTKLVISKNRPFSTQGPCAELYFNPETFDLEYQDETVLTSTEERVNKDG